MAFYIDENNNYTISGKTAQILLEAFKNCTKEKTFAIGFYNFGQACECFLKDMHKFNSIKK